MDFETFTLVWLLGLIGCALMSVYAIFFDKSGRSTFTDEERADIEKYYNEHGTVPKWVITGNSPFRNRV